MTTPPFPNLLVPCFLSYEITGGLLHSPRLYRSAREVNFGAQDYTASASHWVPNPPKFTLTGRAFLEVFARLVLLTHAPGLKVLSEVEGEVFSVERIR